MDFPELRLHLTEIMEELYREKLITATGGNVSLRLHDGQGFLITPSMTHKGGLKPENMVFLGPEGKPVDRQNRPSIEVSMHLKVYEVNPGVGAVVHTHSPYATVLGFYDNLEIAPFSIEALRFAVLPVVPFCMPGSRELVEKVASIFEENPQAQALLLRNHGLLTIGRDLRQAANISEALEEACRMAIVCRLLGEKPALIPEEKQAILKQFLVM